MDMDFEIIDPDDANATIGILAHCGMISSSPSLDRWNGKQNRNPYRHESNSPHVMGRQTGLDHEYRYNKI